MKALSFLQPWAFAVLHLGKTLDNRRMKNGKMPPLCKYRGPLLIHASMRPKHAYYMEAVDWIRDNIGASTANTIPPWCAIGKSGNRMHVGGIIGRCDVVGHVTPERDIFDDPDDAIGGVPRMRHGSWSSHIRWHMPGSYGLILADVEPLPFVPWKGSLGIFNVPDDYATRTT